MTNDQRIHLVKGYEGTRLEEAADEVLMVEYQRGNIAGFNALYKRHAGKIYGYLCSRLADRHHADEVLQEVFLKLHRARSRYDSALPFLPYLFTISRNALFDHLRRRKRHVEEVPILDSHASTLPAPDSLPAERLRHNFPEMDSLSDNQKKALELHFGHDFDFDEMSRLMETSVGNARQLVSRALRKMRALMKTTGN